jgi:hypothetical protein
VRVRWLISASLVLLTAALLASTWLGGGDSAPAKPARYATEHPVSIPVDARTIRISSTMPLPSAHARRLSAMLEQGLMPQRPMTGKVVSDTQCTPDADSISHCRNEMRLDDGSTIVLRHPHRMADVPCLAPGEVVRLVPTGV